MKIENNNRRQKHKNQNTNNQVIERVIQFNYLGCDILYCSKDLEQKINKSLYIWEKIN